jgi:hypothetical protein
MQMRLLILGLVAKRLRIHIKAEDISYGALFSAPTEVGG